VCISATELRTYDRPGLCTDGLCVYAKKTVTCGAGGCVNDACQTDPCANVTCTTPPSACYKSGGTCQGGSCNYPFDDDVACSDGDACTDNDKCNAGVCKGAPKVCATPPSDTCENDYTAKVYDTLGMCSAGSCNYVYRFLSCASGCTSGHCNASGWTRMNSNSNRFLYSVWGSSPSSVWAVGDAGTALYFNGSVWQSRPTPTQVQSSTLLSVHGTSASNVFAIGDRKLIRFDGSQWNFVSAVNAGGTSSSGLPSCVYAYGDNDAFIWGGGGNLYRVTNGTPSLVASSTAQFGLLHQCSIQVFSPTDIVMTGTGIFRYNGSTIDPIGVPSRNGVALWASATNDIFIAYYGNVERWNGSMWQNLSPGLDGALFGIAGTATDRVFAAGFAGQVAPAYATVLRWDGVGWTTEPLPMMVPELHGVWAAPSGEVFAVGAAGAIVRGP
jgi:hypothetical protein